MLVSQSLFLESIRSLAAIRNRILFVDGVKAHLEGFVLETFSVFQFVFVSGDEKNPDDLARLVSPVYNQAGKTCSFDFWYLMKGDSTGGKLRIYLRSHLTESLISVVRDDKVSARWFKHTGALPYCLAQFQVVIEGARGKV